MPLADVNKYVTDGYTMAPDGASCLLTNPAYATIRVTIVPGGVDAIALDLVGGVPKSAVASFGDSPVPGTHSGSTDSPQMAVAYAPAKDSLVVVHVSKPDGDHELLQINAFDVLEEVIAEV